ncbi:hypothetical protein EDB89DRAFT_214674 [Lactarius sanguifluus]|nr:hypothetical protein EDB89DRAFT_214674 [Lactarius sanguifluus]
MGTRRCEAARQTRSHLNAAAYGHLWLINAGRIGLRMFFIVAPTSICQRCWATGHALRPLQLESVVSSSTHFPSPPPLLFSTLLSVPGKIMLNRAISSWTQDKDHSGGGYTSISRTTTQASGIRKRWRTFGQGARSILCICAEGHTDANYTTTTGADVPCGASSAPNSAARRSRPGRRANTSKEAESAWFDKTTEKKRRSEPGAAAAVRRRLRKRAARSGEGSRSNEDDLHHRMARLHLITTTATGERIHVPPPTASGDSTVPPRTRKLLLIGAVPREEEEPGAEKPQQSSGPVNDEKGGADARKAAWEVLKRRVLDAEEHGGEPPLDMGGGGGGHDADRALRKIRARLRQGWAEEVMRVKAREESVKSTKKRRRDAGCWIRENGALLKVHCHGE